MLNLPALRPFRFSPLLLVAIGCLSLSITAATSAQEPSFEIMFNGNDLTGWKGIEKFWSVKDGAIVGKTSPDNPTAGNTFLVWQEAPTGDFEFRCKVKFSGNNSGVQYRSKLVDAEKFVLHGNQADLHPSPDYFGMLYGEGTRGITARRGQRVVVSEDGKSQVVGKVGNDDVLVDDEWNDLRIVAVGDRCIHQINGNTTIDITDRHPDAIRSGVIGLQLHAGPPMQVEFRNLLIRRLNGDQGKALIATLEPVPAATDDDSVKKVDKDPVAWLTSDSTPSWIWLDEGSGEQQAWFRRAFALEGKPKSAKIYAVCDNEMALFINGKLVGNSNDWKRPIEKDVSDLLVKGRNIIAIAAQNHGGPGGLAVKLVCDGDAVGAVNVVSEATSWRITETESSNWNQVEFDDSQWMAPKVVGKLGDAPWGIPNYTASTNSDRRLAAKDIVTPPGFVAELVYAVPPEQGSWVSLATDSKGRIYACDQGDAGLYRLTVREGSTPQVESVSVGDLAGLSGAQGLLWEGNNLWFHRNGGHLFRLQDRNDDDQLDFMEDIPSTTGGGEHGNHALILTEDRAGIYLASGNHSPMAEPARSRVPTWGEDLLLPRLADSNGHANGIMAPGGFVMRLDLESRTQTVHTVGFRNQYDLTLNRQGDLFTYDADMEYDLGLPWYRPTRICQVVSGADYGWRNGSGKWPDYYEDSLPAVVDIGPGSPTGIVSGGRTRFPTRYQDSLFALDWTFGTIYAIHLQTKGAGYTGQAEPFVYGSPLPVTDVVVGHDGALYFAVGGRGTQSALFRIRYIGNESLDRPVDSDADAIAAQARRQRRELEAYHGVVNAAAVQAAWPYLSSTDRVLRHAARIAIESQPVEQWVDRVLQESDSQARITGAVALARMGAEANRGPLLESLHQLDPSQLNSGQLLGLLRAYSLICIRLGSLNPDQRASLIRELDPLLPNTNDDVNTELIRVLAFLRSPLVAGKAMKLIAARKPPTIPQWSTLASRNSNYGGTVERMLANHPPTREIGYAFMLRNLRDGWSLDLRRQYFTFLNEAAKASGGASYANYLTRTRDEALAHCTDSQRTALKDITGENFNPVPDFEITKPSGPGRVWTVEDALQMVGTKSDFERGRSLFFGASCAQCHRVRGLGGNIGPDLTSIPNKFDLRYVLETTINPSKDISDQYASSVIALADGRLINGLMVEHDGGKVTLFPGAVGAEPIELTRDDIDEVRPSKVSQMPENLLDGLSADELNDLLGYLMAGGDASHKRFKKD